MACKKEEEKKSRSSSMYIHILDEHKTGRRESLLLEPSPAFKLSSTSFFCFSTPQHQPLSHYCYHTMVHGNVSRYKS